MGAHIAAAEVGVGEDANLCSGGGRGLAMPILWWLCKSLLCSRGISPRNPMQPVQYGLSHSPDLCGRQAPATLKLDSPGLKDPCPHLFLSYPSTEYVQYLVVQGAE